MKIAHAELYTTSNIVCNFWVQYMQYCRIISLDNNNSVKFTSSSEDNSTTTDSIVMKIAQIHMYTNIMYKFQNSMCKTVGEKLRTKLCPRTDSHGDTPLRFVVGGINKETCG